MKSESCAAAEILALELLGFASGARSLQAKVGEKPKSEPPDGFFDPPEDDDEPEER
jgi:hypothetical protein